MAGEPLKIVDARFYGDDASPVLNRRHVVLHLSRDLTDDEAEELCLLLMGRRADDG